MAYDSNYTKPIFLKMKAAPGKWITIEIIRIKNIPKLGGRVVVGRVVSSYNNIYFGSINSDCKLVKYNKKYDSYKTF